MQEAVVLTILWGLAYGAEALPDEPRSVIICGNGDGRPCELADYLDSYRGDADSKGWWWVICRESGMCDEWALGGYATTEALKRKLTQHARCVSFWEEEDTRRFMCRLEDR